MIDEGSPPGETRKESMPEDDKEEAVGPEELVRRETKAVRCLRFVLIAVLIVVGGFLAFVTYKFGTEAERKAYSKGFEGVSTRLTDSYATALTQLMWSAYSIGVAVTSNANLVESAPNFVIPNFDDLVKGAMQTNRVPLVLWAPLIKDETMKQEWESFAQQQLQTKQTGAEVCNVCGSESQSVGAPDVKVLLPIGTYTCGQIEWAGKTGVVSNKNCPLLVPYVQKNCMCSASGSVGGSYLTGRNSSSQVSGAILKHGSSEPVDGPGPYLPVWQISPSTFASFAMHDLLTDKEYYGSIKEMIRTRKTIISKASLGNGTGSYMFSPVFGGTGNSTGIIGSIIFVLSWDDILGGIVPLGSKGTFVVLENSCGQKRTFQSTGDVLEVVGLGDQHDPSYNDQMKQTTFEDYYTAQTWASPYSTATSSHLNCAYKISVYPSAEYRSNYITNKPRDYAIGVILIFVCTCIVFAVYDCHVARRQRKVMKAALQRDEIVSSLFPDAVRGRLFRRGQSQTRVSGRSWETTLARIKSTKGQRRSSTVTSSTDDESILTNPLPKRGTIADYFPCVTVVFADISGFTAWSSEHDPSQVFHLLETVYRTFDRLANRYGVFKIETIGDCYVAVAGLPEFQPDHAVRVVKFAYACIQRMHNLIHDLQDTLGPSTLALSIRIGIHSGPVIAGVLRGEKSRFQLFGDTMNTTSRVQTTGEINRIQISTTTAKLLEEANKSHWIQPRDELVAMKGKGLVQTFWVNVDDFTEEEDFARGSSTLSGHVPEVWASSAMLPSLLQSEIDSEEEGNATESIVAMSTTLLMDFLKKVIMSHLQGSSASDGIIGRDNDFMEVEHHLQSFVAAIAASYSDNPYHNFEHASNVARLAAEIIGLMESPRNGDPLQHNSNNLKLGDSRRDLLGGSSDISNDVALQNQNQTCDISNENVLMHFAVVLFAIIRDVKRPAVQRTVSFDETKNKIAVENVGQKGIDYAWSLLLTDQHHKVLRSICADCQKHQLQFRRTLEQAAAMFAKVSPASDEMGIARSQGGLTEEGIIDSYTKDKFKCIVLASEMAHKMQDWATFKLWNERQWEESTLDHQSGISEHDPAAGWYEAEIQCFDDIVIPLAQKISEFGGGVSDRFLRFAKDNREKWELEGREIVRALIEKYRIQLDT